MNRRRLIFTALGVLGATAIAPVAQVVANFPLATTTKIPIAELFVSVSADVSAALARPPAGIGAGFTNAVRVPAVFEHQMSSARAVMTKDELEQFVDALTGLDDGHLASIGSLIVRI